MVLPIFWTATYLMRTGNVRARAFFLALNEMALLVMWHQDQRPALFLTRNPLSWLPTRLGRSLQSMLTPAQDGFLESMSRLASIQLSKFQSSSLPLIVTAILPQNSARMILLQLALIRVEVSCRSEVDIQVVKFYCIFKESNQFT